ncbi:MAG TPA: hypothetical protein V6C82_06650 [Chroococcales cyanobacterium]|jgi:hypothetical protein
MSGQKPGEPKLKPEAEKLVQEFKKKRQEIQAASRTIKSRLAYMDQMAKQFKDQLKQFNAQPPTPELQVKISRMERKIAAYEVVRRACASLEQTLEAATADYSTRQILLGKIGSASPKETMEFAMAEAELVVINARLMVDDLAPRMRLVQSAMGQPVKLEKTELATVSTLKARINASVELKQRLGTTLQYFQEATAAVAQGEKDLVALKQLTGKEAYVFLGKMKPQQISGKLYHLERLHQIYAAEPLMANLFPPPEAVTFPSNTVPDKKGTAPLTGRLLDLFGLGEKKN